MWPMNHCEFNTTAPGGSSTSQQNKDLTGAEIDEIPLKTNKATAQRVHTTDKCCCLWDFKSRYQDRNLGIKLSKKIAGFIQKQNYGWCELQQANDRITTSARVTFDIPCRCLPGLPYKIG